LKTGLKVGGLKVEYHCIPKILLAGYSLIMKLSFLIYGLKNSFMKIIFLIFPTRLKINPKKGSWGNISEW